MIEDSIKVGDKVMVLEMYKLDVLENISIGKFLGKRKSAWDLDVVIKVKDLDKSGADRSFGHWPVIRYDDNLYEILKNIKKISFPMLQLIRKLDVRNQWRK